MMSSVDPGGYEPVTSVVANVRDFSGKDGAQMREVELAGTGKCLLVKNEDGAFSAIGNKCTHYGAPLVKGALRNGKVQCPWHGACFNVKTGDIEDFPGLDSLQNYKVEVNKSTGDISVTASQRTLKDNRRNPCLEGSNAVGKDKHVVVVGGGPSSQVCVEKLRSGGFGGKITIITKEVHLPYDRAKLSKALDVEPQKLYLRKDEKFYREICVDVLNNTEVISIDSDKMRVRTSSGQDINYDKLVLATGGTPRSLEPTPGWNLENVFAFRTVDDAGAIARSAKDKRVVVVGSSFIGMEVASYMTSRKLASSVAVVTGKRSKVPFEKSLGEVIGKRIMQMHEEKGVKFHPSAGVAELRPKPDDGRKVGSVVLTNGEVIDADVVVLGIGVAPATKFINDGKITKTNQGYIPVDSRMRTNVENVYAVGDIVTFPLRMKDGQSVNIQHWQMAHKHGQIAAKDIVDTYSKTDNQTTSNSVHSVPFFWTVQFGVSIRYAGHADGYTDTVIRTVDDKVSEEDAVAAAKFVVFYLKNDQVIAVATLKTDPVAARFAQHIASGKILHRSGIDEFLRD